MYRTPWEIVHEFAQALLLLVGLWGFSLSLL